MRRVLFVDDERQVLEGLRTSLFRQRRVWDMHFAESGEAALAFLARNPVDVVVADMRMPGMDGASLLERVRSDHPNTARVVLSGHADVAEVVRAIPTMQRFLGKPCDHGQLKQVIEELCALQDRIHGDAMRALIGSIKCLPTFPESFRALDAALRSPAGSLQSTSTIIERDAGLSAKIMHIANSACFRGNSAITSVSAAVRRLGFELIQGLAVSSQIFEQIDAEVMHIASLASLPQRSFWTAHLAREIAGASHAGDTAFCAAVMADVGQIVFALGLREQYGTLVVEAARAGRPLVDAEREAFGFTHAEVGAYLLDTWGLPAAIVESIAGHHEPDRWGGEPNPTVVVLYIAETLVEAVRAGVADVPAALSPRVRTLPFVQEGLPAWIAITREMLAATP